VSLPRAGWMWLEDVSVKASRKMDIKKLKNKQKYVEYFFLQKAKARHW
jgi:hypothetical protein